MRACCGCGCTLQGAHEGVQERLLGGGVPQVVHTAQAARGQLLGELLAVPQEAAEGLLHLPQAGNHRSVLPREAGQAGQPHAPCAAYLSTTCPSRCSVRHQCQLAIYRKMLNDATSNLSRRLAQAVTLPGSTMLGISSCNVQNTMRTCLVGRLAYDPVRPCQACDSAVPQDGSG